MPHGSPGTGAGTGRAGGVGGANVGGGFSSRDVTQGRDGGGLLGGAGFRLAPAPTGVPGTNRGIFQNIMDSIAARFGAVLGPVGGGVTNFLEGIFGPSTGDLSPGGVVRASDLEALGPGGEGGQGFGGLIAGRRPFGQPAQAPVPFSQTPEFAQLLAQIQARRAASLANVSAGPAAAAAPPPLNIPAANPFQPPPIFGNLIAGGQ